MLPSPCRQSDYREQCCIMVQKSAGFDIPASILNTKMRWLIFICGHTLHKNGNWEMDRGKKKNRRKCTMHSFIFSLRGQGPFSQQFIILLQLCTFLVLLSLNELVFILHSVSSQSTCFFHPYLHKITCSVSDQRSTYCSILLLTGGLGRSINAGQAHSDSSLE